MGTNEPLVNTNIPSIGVKVSSSQSVPKRPEMKTAISTLSDVNPGNSSVQKKKPKINWTQNNIQREEVSANNNSKTADSLAPNTPTQSVAAAVKSLPTKEKGVALNGLQALSQSYGDSDTGDSRESSPPS